MTLNEYQAEMRRTRRDMSYWDGIFEAGLGLCAESGEFADHLKKAAYHGHDLSKDELVKELGDVLWYVAAGAEALGVTLEDVAKANIAKRLARYPNGFAPERSRNREAIPVQEHEAELRSGAAACGIPKSETHY